MALDPEAMIAAQREYDAGIAAYKQGRKQPQGCSADFRDGWNAADDDPNVKFGPFETPRQAPEEPYRWTGDDAPQNDREEAIYRRGWNDALTWAFGGIA